MAGYTRQSEGEINPGDDIAAAPLNAEFDAIAMAFSNTGHTHDGTTGNGPKLPFTSLNTISNMKLLGNVSGNTGNVTQVTIYDEDNFSSNSDTGVPTQQSVKSYVDSRLAPVVGTIASQNANNVSITGGTITGITDITVADGGTGVSSFTDGGVIIGNGGSSLQVTTAGTSGQVLMSNGTGNDPSFKDPEFIGDFKDTVRTLDSKWLKRDGSVYDRSTYPDLAAYFPTLPDTMSWGTATFDSAPSASYVCRGIAQSSTIKVAIFNNGSGLGMSIYSSSDNGASWTARYSSGTKNVGEIWRGTNEFAVFARDTSGACSVIRSPNGTSWTSSDIPGTSNFSVSGNFTSSYFDGSYYITDSDGKIHRSTDASSWTSVTRAGRVIIAAPTKAILVDSGTYYQSADHGATWSALGSNPFSTYSGVTAGVYDSTRSLYIYGTGAGNIVTAPDGVTLNSRHTVTSAGWYRGNTSANGIILSGLGTSSVSISVDGTSFTDFAVPGSGTVSGVLADSQISGRFIVGRGNVIYYGTRITSSQFRVPSDDPTYGWIKATD